MISELTKKNLEYINNNSLVWIVYSISTWNKQFMCSVKIAIIANQKWPPLYTNKVQNKIVINAKG